MDFEKEASIPLASLKDCPVKITLHTDSQIESIKRTARTAPDSIPPLDVAEISDEKTLVIVDGHARAEALKSFGIDKIRAKLHSVQNMTEAVILHVQLNQRSHLNPLRFYDAYEFLKENGHKSEDIPKELRLTESYSRLFKINLSEKARVCLERYLDELASKYSVVHLPVYVIESIAKIKEEHQVKAVDMMIQMIPQNISEFKFSFPSFDQLEIAFSSFRKEEKERDPIIFSLKNNEEDRARGPTSKTLSSSTLTSDDKKPPEQNKPDVRAIPSKEEIDEARELISNVPNRALIKCPHGTKYLVDMKDHTISEVKEKNNVISISGDSAEPVFMIPSKHASFLQLEYGDPVYFKSFASPKQLLKFVERIKDEDQRIVLISSQRFESR